MKSVELRDLINQKRPLYKKEYRDMIEAISIKGDRTRGGTHSTFGAFYRTYMYAFIIGYKLGKQNFITAEDKSPVEFAPIGQWQPVRIREFICMLILNKSSSFGFTWSDLEDASEETINVFVTEFVNQIQGYANAGLEYLQDKWDKDRFEFQDPFVFVNILEDLNHT
jgi:hypothetical protein